MIRTKVFCLLLLQLFISTSAVVISSASSPEIAPENQTSSAISSRNGESGYSSVIAVGDGLRLGKINVYNHFRLYGVRDSELSVKVIGPVEADVLIQSERDGGKKISYRPTVPGHYTITVRIDGHHILDSPFRVKITGDSDTVEGVLVEEIPKKPKHPLVDVSGHGIKRGHVNEWNEIVVDTSKDKYGQAKVMVRGPSNKIEVRETGFHNDVVRFFYRVGKPGKYHITITYNGVEVAGSPFEVVVGEGSVSTVSTDEDESGREIVPSTPAPTITNDGPDVRLSGTGFPVGFVDEWNELIVDCTRAGPGSLSVVMSGLTEVEWQSQQLSTARFRYYFRSRSVGEYQLEVEFNHQKIPGSPFKVIIKKRDLPKPDTLPDDDSSTRTVALNVKASGQGIVQGIVGKWNDIHLDTSGSSSGKLTVSVSGPGKVIWNKSPFDHGVITYSYRTYEPGMYEITVKMDDQHIPGSPFQVQVVPSLALPVLRFRR